MIPAVNLLQAPMGETDPFGAAMTSHEILTGLRKIDPRFNIWEEYPDGFIWPGKVICTDQVQSSLWLGQPGTELKQDDPFMKPYIVGGKKITGIPIGVVPEWTRFDGQGRVIKKGWRAILTKVVLSTEVTRAQLEVAFPGISMQKSDRSDGSCKRCRRTGIVKKGYGKRQLCKTHEGVENAVANAHAQKVAMKPNLSMI